MSYFITKRYHSICDQRDAYQGMQEELTSAIDKMTLLYKSESKEKERLQMKLDEVVLSSMESQGALREILAVVGVSLFIFPIRYLCVFLMIYFCSFTYRYLRKK